MEAVSDILREMTQYKVEDVTNFLIKVLISVLAIALGVLISRVAKKMITKMIMKHNAFTNNPKTISAVASSIGSYVIIFFVICNVLPIWGISISSIIAIGGIASLSIGMGAQGVIKDMLSGFFILSESQYVIGDIVTIDGYTGKVENIGMRTTRIRSVDGNVHIIPNGQILVVTNMSKGFNRAVVDVGIAYDEDIDNVIEILKKEMKSIYESKEIKGLLDLPQVLGVEKLADSSVIIRITADSEIGENWQIERELRRLIKKRLSDENIEIPFPQTVVHIKEGQ